MSHQSHFQWFHSLVFGAWQELWSYVLRDFLQSHINASLLSQNIFLRISPIVYVPPLLWEMNLHTNIKPELIVVDLYTAIFISTLREK
jgi:hypothetical protein